MSDLSENKYDDIRLPSYEESSIIDKITEDRNRLIKATSELDRIKIEMELRIRAEMEEKVRVEIESKMRSEMEERIRQEEIEKKKKEESDKQRLYKELSMEIEKNWQEQIKVKYNGFVKDDIILFIGYSQHINDNGIYQRVNASVLITNKNFYQIRSEENKNFLDIYYTFDNELSSKDIAIISQLFVRKGKYNTSFIEEQVSLNYGYLSNNAVNYMITKKIESVIRLIPGSYKNGDWEQLDGFYGMYFNRKTLELSEFPPPL
jgi:hypothetical protein